MVLQIARLNLRVGVLIVFFPSVDTSERHAKT